MIADGGFGRREWRKVRRSRERRWRKSPARSSGQFGVSATSISSNFLCASEIGAALTHGCIARQAPVGDFGHDV
jgi:hypothetical protein